MPFLVLFSVNLCYHIVEGDHMDTYRIECFLAAAQTGSLTKAAEKMCISQPAMSFQIREMERELQMPLFVRDHNGVRLTEAGKIMQAGFLHIMDSYRRLIDKALSRTYGKLRLTIGYHGLINWAGIHNFIAAFSDRHPEFEIVVMQQQWRELADYLEIGALDVAFLETSELPDRDTLSSLHLFNEATCFAMRRSHPLAGRDKVTCSDIAKDIVLMNNHPSRCMNELIQHLKNSGIREDQLRYFDQLDNSLAMAAAGQGITSLPLSFRQNEVDLSYVEYDSPACYMSFSLAWKSDTENPAVKLFCAEVSRAPWPYS